ncbi:MAG TPA: hypothetical protein VFN67_07055 [Polyangiales bacterium]|nr:hypothetical protein [Polyangiales bacterium]
MKKLVNYDLLRGDLFEGRSESVYDVATATGVDRSVLAKFRHGGDSFRALSLEHFVKLVIWLDKPADRYIYRPLREVDGAGEDVS